MNLDYWYPLDPPLLCRLGFHRFIPHAILGPRFLECRRCGWEEWK